MIQCRMDPRSDSRTPGAPVTGAQLASWLYHDAALERERVSRLAILAANRPDLAPLCEILAEDGYRRGATATMLAGALPRLATPVAPAPPGWRWRIRAAWAILWG